MTEREWIEQARELLSDLAMETVEIPSLNRIDALLAEPVKPSPRWVGNVFKGDPPAPYESWYEWVEAATESGLISGVTISRRPAPEPPPEPEPNPTAPCPLCGVGEVNQCPPPKPAPTQPELCGACDGKGYRPSGAEYPLPCPVCAEPAPREAFEAFEEAMRRINHHKSFLLGEHSSQWAQAHADALRALAEEVRAR